MFRLHSPHPTKDLCDPQLPKSRRDFLRVGGSGMLGLTLGSMFQMQAATAAAGVAKGGPGWGKAKSVILVYLQGGPSHIDLWDPKPDAPDNVRSAFKSIPTKLTGEHFTEILPKLAQVNDRFSMIRSMSYTPNGLFNHTAAIYQMMTGYTTDKVSPSGQLEPPQPQGLPELRIEHHSPATPRGTHAPVRHASPPATGKRSRREGRNRRIPGTGLRPLYLVSRRGRHGHEEDGPDQGR